MLAAGEKNCILWTSSEKQRVRYILEYYNLERKFCKIFFNKKRDFKKDIAKITRFLDCGSNDIIFYDDDKGNAEALTRLGLIVNPTKQTLEL